MYIAKAISVNNGWDVLSLKSEALSDIKSIVGEFSHEALLDAERPRDIIDPNEVRSFAFSRLFLNTSRKYGWYNLRALHSKAPYHPVYFKFNVALETAFKQYPHSEGQIDRWVLVDVEREQSNSDCDVSVLLTFDQVPDWYFRSPSQHPLFPEYDFSSNFEGVLSHLQNTLLPIYHHKPLVVLALSEQECVTELIELDNTKNSGVIERVLEFSAEHYQAGVGILSYFSEILQQKCPEVDAKVKIEQDGYLVRMIIDTPDGNRDIVEKALTSYSMVLSNQKKASDLLDDKLHIHKLEMKLELAATEVRQTRQLLAITQDNSQKRIQTLEESLACMQQHMKDQLMITRDSQTLMGQYIAKEEKVQLAQLSNQNMTIQALIQQSSQNEELTKALSYIESLVERETPITDADKNTTTEILKTIHHESPSIYSELNNLMKNAMYGVSGNIVFGWMQELSAVLEKMM